MVGRTVVLKGSIALDAEWCPQGGQGSQAFQSVIVVDGGANVLWKSNNIGNRIISVFTSPSIHPPASHLPACLPTWQRAIALKCVTRCNFFDSRRAWNPFIKWAPHVYGRFCRMTILFPLKTFIDPIDGFAFLLIFIIIMINFIGLCDSLLSSHSYFHHLTWDGTAYSSSSHRADLGMDDQNNSQ